MNSNRYVAFFDLDHTILSINSGKALIQIAYRKGLLTHPELLRAFWFSIAYKMQLGDTIKLLVKMVAWIKGKDEKSLDDLSEIVYNEVIINSIRKEITSEITSHKERGAVTAILSSSIMPICSRVAGHLGIDDILCSILEIEDNVYTGKASTNICFGKEKAVRLTEYCSKNNINISDSYYYGDSIDDLHALSIVGYPVCVYPDKKLRTIAESRGWRIIC